ncbi:protein SRC2-like [Gossypium australe]|uniref:Protein SRC2-like n=1 Tax=Gossypium australe TaxID=47621 RepID=A0A5B6W4H0_9ROSI|nr:protein SRC2-like [Gossypium australe]
MASPFKTEPINTLNSPCLSESKTNIAPSSSNFLIFTSPRNQQWPLAKKYTPVKPYVVVWVDPNNKLSTKVNEKVDSRPTRNSTLVIPLPDPINDETNLCVDVFHSGNEDLTKSFIGLTISWTS